MKILVIEDEKLLADSIKTMLVGMNATATIVLSTAEQVLTIPADALDKKGNATYVLVSASSGFGAFGSRG